MADRPILFNAAMVRALLAGTKTQTRRVVKPAKCKVMGVPMACCEIAGEINQGDYTNSHYGQPGDRLWVREAWAAPHKYDGHRPADIPALTRWHYAATENLGGLLGRPSIHMPRCASRITLEVTGVRVERLQNISEADALAEGIVPAGDGNGFQLADTKHYSGNPIDSYFSLWEHINGAGSVEANPWVWVVEFKRLETAA